MSLASARERRKRFQVDEPLRLLICAGGTGGGVYPAMAVLQALRARELRQRSEPKYGAALPLSSPPKAAHWEVLWVGSVGGMEAELVKRANVPYREIEAAGVHGVGLSALPGNLWRLWRGYRQSRAIVSAFRPHVLFFTGGYLAVPMALAGRKVPSLLYVPDIEPGLALKTIGRMASHIAVTVEESRRYYPTKARVSVSGYPVRQELTRWKRSEGRRALGLCDDLPVLMVFGGSKGARSINRALLKALPHLLGRMQVLHLTGTLDWSHVEQERHTLPQKLQESFWAQRYHPYPYLHDEMGAALAAADLVVCRAGASTLGELPAFGLPAILVPYPHAWRYQRVNAEYLAERGAALLLEDHLLEAELAPTVLELMEDVARLEEMRQAMSTLARPGAADHIAEVLESLATKHTQQGRRL